MGGIRVDRQHLGAAGAEGDRGDVPAEGLTGVDEEVAVQVEAGVLGDLAGVVEAVAVAVAQVREGQGTRDVEASKAKTSLPGVPATVTVVPD